MGSTTLDGKRTFTPSAHGTCGSPAQQARATRIRYGCRRLISRRVTWAFAGAPKGAGANVRPSGRVTILGRDALSKTGSGGDVKSDAWGSKGDADSGRRLAAAAILASEFLRRRVHLRRFLTNFGKLRRRRRRFRGGTAYAQDSSAATFARTVGRRRRCALRYLQGACLRNTGVLSSPSRDVACLLDVASQPNFIRQDGLRC
jgi:hypothetical protein